METGHSLPEFENSPVLLRSPPLAKVVSTGHTHRRKCISMSIAYTDNNTQTALTQSTLLEVASPFEYDPTEPGSASAKQAKGQKANVKELQQRIAELEVKLE